ncbi:uncharacterized protein JCM15063_003502 [Sporobolomyces koalae]|uniref:uncharacterized protein n=1 Tax=Sporobolomyces koalae TaxID=500713 RepID=UPI00317B8746
MPTSITSGFSAALVYPVQDPETQVLLHGVVTELGTAAVVNGGICAFVELPEPQLQYRIFFARDPRVLPLDQNGPPEVYAAYATTFDPDLLSSWDKYQLGTRPQSHVRYFAIGPGVSTTRDPPEWFLEGHFGDAPENLVALNDTCVELLICRAVPIQGADLRCALSLAELDKSCADLTFDGRNGILSKEAIASIDVEHPVCYFRWHYASQDMLQELGLFPLPSPLLARQSSSSTASLTFLHEVIECLITCLNVDQKRDLIEAVRSREESEVVTAIKLAMEDKNGPPLPRTASHGAILYIATRKLDPFDVLPLNEGAYAAYAVPSEDLAIGSEWLVVWRDDRALEHEAATVVGMVYETEGSGRDAASRLVGTCVTCPGNQQHLPFVKGIIRSPSQQHVAPTSPEDLQHDLSQESMHGSSHDSQDILLMRIDQLEHDLAIEKEKARYFEVAASKLYDRLSPSDEIDYLEQRLTTEILAPTVRISIALAKQRALEKLEKQEKEYVAKEVERFIAKLRDPEGGGGGDEVSYLDSAPAPNRL